MSVFTLQNLLPSGEDLFLVAYSSTSGDAVVDAVGTHQGRDPHRRDTMGISKRMVHDHAVRADLVWFSKLSEQLKKNPHKMPPSLRTLIMKDENDPTKGTRPIDDPSELKRLACLHVRKLLQEMAESRMTPGQLGGRPAASIYPYCKRKGSTTQDHLATALHQEIWNGRPICLMADLKDAFGLVPRAAAIQAFKNLGLDKKAASWLWRLVRIDAVDTKDQGKKYRRVGRGIEQGNPLSSTVMNLVLASIFMKMEGSLPVKIYAYLDDIYIMSNSVQTAEKAFKDFRDLAHKNGFTNVRRLWKPGDPTDSKLSRIVDCRKETMTVLKTYEVDQSGISLHLKKIKELQEEGLVKHPVKMSDLRNCSNCRALTKGATKTRNKDVLVTRNSMSKISWSRSCPAPAGEGIGSIQDSTRKHHPNIQEDRCKDDGESPSISKDEPGHVSYENHYPNEIVDHIGHNDSYEGIAMSECCLESICQDGVPDGNMDYIHDFLSNGLCLHSHKCQDLGNQAGGIPALGDNPATERGDTLGKTWTGTAAPSRILPFFFLVQPSPGSAGNAFKGHVLDLRGLEDHLSQGDSTDIIQLVNRLIKLVRTQRKAVILIDPSEAWTSLPGILGNHGDPTYQRTSYEYLPDGSVQVSLVQEKKHRKAPKHTKSPTPKVDLALMKVRCVNLGLFQYEVRFQHQGRQHREIFQVTTPNGTAGAIEAVVEVLEKHQPNTVAIRLQGALGVAEYLPDREVTPAHTVLHQSWKRLQRWRWLQEEGWVMGKRE